MTNPNNRKNNLTPIQVLKRIFGYIWRDYKKIFIVVIFAIVISGVVSAINTIFIQVLIDNYINPMMKDPTIIDATMSELNIVLLVVGGLYILAVIAIFI